MLHQIKQYVDENYHRGISLGKLAEEFNVSTRYLSKLFLEQVGQHFSDYINGLKVRKAMELLKTTDQRMYEIADFLGFKMHITSVHGSSGRVGGSRQRSIGLIPAAPNPGTTSPG